jgi:nucleoside triphosphatase
MNKIPKIAVGVLILNNEEKIFLAKSPKWNNMWIVPGGKLDYGETLKECVKREVKEETGLNITNVKFLEVLESIKSKEFHDEKHFIFLDFTCKAINNEVVLLERELNEYKWVTPEEGLKMNTNSSTRHFIETYIKESKSKTIKS